jgi:ribonuclease T2
VRALVKIPDAYIDLKEPLTVTADEVEESFINSNSGLTRDAISVTCDSRRLGEVRICLGKDFKFHSCPDVDGRACRRENIVMPPVRDGSAALAR